MTFVDQVPVVDQHAFFLEENGQPILPYVPASYLCVNSAKILDGLFIGNKDAAIDLEFITSNKITHIINCVGHLLPNTMMKYGIQYLTFQWIDAKTTVLFDQDGKNLNRIVAFIHAALQNHTGVLIFSVHGKSRSCCVASAFLMQYFGWSLQKSLEFIQFKRPDINPKPYYLRQLKRIEKVRQPKGVEDGVSARWLEGCESNSELVARNTFLNGHYIKTESEFGKNIFKIYEDFESDTNARPASSSGRLQWKDQVDPTSSLELSPGVKYSTSSRPSSASRNGPSPILKNTRPPTPSSPKPANPIGESISPANLKPSTTANRAVRSAWNGSPDSPPSTLTRTISSRPSSAQSEHEDQQAQNLTGGLLWRHKLGRFDNDDDKYRKSVPRPSSVVNAATVSSLAKVKRNVVKFRSSSSTTKASSMTTLSNTRRTKSRSSPSPNSTQDWVMNLSSMSLLSKESKPMRLGSASLDLQALSLGVPVHGRRPASAGSIKTRTY